jgi:tetratricopeptide (TPR) repeat protein
MGARVSSKKNHRSLLESGLKLHESRRYSRAVTVFERAAAATPQCAVAQYNLANTLHMLARHQEAGEILRILLATPNDILLAGCPLSENPRRFKLDALFLLFLATLYDKRDWKIALPFAEQHLASRRRGLRSAWSVAQVRSLMAELAIEFAA